MIKFKLKEIMEDKNIKISELNEATGISRNSLSLLINGKSRGIQFETLEKIVSALNINIGDLFEKTFNNLEIILHDKKSVFVTRNESNYNRKNKNTNKREKIALECTIYEDNIARKGYIPYSLNLEFNPEPQLEVNILLNYSEFYSFLRNLFEDDRRFSYIFYDYFLKKIFINEKEKIDLMEKTFDINIDHIHARLPGGGSSAYISTNINKTSDTDIYIEQVINELNSSNMFSTEYTNSIRIFSE